MATRVPTRKPAGGKARPASPLLQGPAFVAAATQYITLKAQETTLKKRLETLNKQLKAAIEVHGYDEEGGHQVYDLPEAVGSITALKREKRTIQNFNDEKAEGFFRAKKLWIPVKDGGVVETIELCDQDAVLRLAFDKAITEKELNSLYDENVTWALVQVKK